MSRDATATPSLERGESPEDFERAEFRRLEQIERRALPVALAGVTLIAAIGFATGRTWLYRPASLGALGFFAGYVMVRRGFVRAAALAFVATAIALVTNSSVTGQGLRDPSTLAYPVIILFAGMTLKIRGFLSTLALIAASVVLVSLSHLYSWVSTETAFTSPSVDAIIIAVILSATAYASWLLASGSKDSLLTAHDEIRRRREVESELQHLSSLDALTGVYNRRFFDAELNRLEPARHYPVSIVVADVDGLKTINDEHGHAAGDRLLVAAASALTSVVRVEDVLARIGGDEFAILFPDTNEEAAQDAVARIEHRLAEQLGDEEGRHVSLSIGSATSTTGDLAQALSLADSRMYARKSERRKRIADQPSGL